MKYGIVLLGIVVFCFVGRSDGETQETWYFGEGLKAGDEFTYNICDYVLPDSQNNCYKITMRFLVLLPSYDGNVWIVATHIEQNTRESDMIFHVSEKDMSIRTDPTNIRYATSVQRTIGWIAHLANENRPQPLRVGSLWGHANSPNLIVSSTEAVEGEQTYLLENSDDDESHVQIRDGFAFPLRAAVHRQPFSFHDLPLAFEFEILDHRDFDILYMCKDQGSVPAD